MDNQDLLDEDDRQRRPQRSRDKRRRSSPSTDEMFIGRRAYWGMIARFFIAVLFVAVVLWLGIWAMVLEGENSDGAAAQGRRMAQLNNMLWEKCTPQAKPPTVYKDEGVYLAADPTDVQFLSGWTSASHRCLPWDPESTGSPSAFGIWFDGILQVGAGKTLQANRISPTFSDPAYLTRWTSFPLTVGVPARCSYPAQQGAFYLVLQVTGAPLPCMCTAAGEICYHYPDPGVTDPVFLNDNKQVP